MIAHGFTVPQMTSTDCAAEKGARYILPAAKAGIQILTQDLAAQVGPYGIRANCIAPETILTERNRELIPAVRSFPCSLRSSSSW